MLVGALAVAAGGAPGDAAADTALERAEGALRAHPVYVDRPLRRLVRPERLAYAARVASRAADGRRIVIAFLNVRDARLDGFRDRLYRRLRLAGRDGALIVATPTTITMRTPNLAPDAELAIIRHNAAKLRLPPRPYTASLAELVYDTGLVIHNTTPGATPRGSGRDRNLATFGGRFPGEPDQEHRGFPWLPLAIILAGALAAAAFVARGLSRRPNVLVRPRGPTRS
jgi:hypothetical protein